MSCAARSWQFQQPAFAQWGTPRPRSRRLCTAAILRGSDNPDGGGKGIGSLAVSPGLALDPQTHFLTALCSPEAAAAACVVRYLDALARAGLPGSPAAQRWGNGGGSAGGSSGRPSSAGSAPLPLVWQAVSSSLFFTRLSAASEHGFSSAQQRQLAPDVLAQLQRCLAAHKVSPAAASLPCCWHCAWFPRALLPPSFLQTQCFPDTNRLQLYGGRAESDADVANVLRVLLGSALEGGAAALPALFAVDQVREANECHWEHAVSASAVAR
jgi:hypothetical protein